MESGRLTPIPTTTPYPTPSGRTGAIVLDDIVKKARLPKRRRIQREGKLGTSLGFMNLAGSASPNRIWNCQTRGATVSIYFNAVDVGRRAGGRDRKQCSIALRSRPGRRLEHYRGCPERARQLHTCRCLKIVTLKTLYRNWQRSTVLPRGK